LTAIQAKFRVLRELGTTICAKGHDVSSAKAVPWADALHLC
jgi:hypothetical protein